MFAEVVVGLVLLAAVVAPTPIDQRSVEGDPNYSSFAYDVSDPHTGDFKTHVEERIGNAVRGQYSLIDPDGTKRIVDYTADAINGFNAVIRKEPLPVVGEVHVPIPASVAPVPDNFVTTLSPIEPIHRVTPVHHVPVSAVKTFSPTPTPNAFVSSAPVEITPRPISYSLPSVTPTSITVTSPSVPSTTFAAATSTVTVTDIPEAVSHIKIVSPTPLPSTPLPPTSLPILDDSFSRDSIPFGLPSFSVSSTAVPITASPVSYTVSPTPAAPVTALPISYNPSPVPSAIDSLEQYVLPRRFSARYNAEDILRAVPNFFDQSSDIYDYARAAAFKNFNDRFSVPLVFTNRIYDRHLRPELTHYAAPPSVLTLPSSTPSTLFDNSDLSLVSSTGSPYFYDKKKK